MRTHLTPDDIANGIRMIRDQYSGSFLIVEGEMTDLRVFRYLIAPESCHLIPAHGKTNAIDALHVLEKNGFQGVLAIVDADFWRLEGKEPGTQNLFVTDTHDLQTMILASPALDKLLDEFGSPAKIQKITEREERTVRQLLLDSARPIGYFRWISQTQEFSLTFEGMRFNRFIDADCLAVDTSKLIKAVKDKSCRHDLEDEALKHAIEEVADPNHNPWDVCCGHDLVRILSQGLRKALGSNQPKDVNPEALQRAMRMAYEFAHFAATQLYVSLRSWESANQPFQVLLTQ